MNCNPLRPATAWCFAVTVLSFLLLFEGSHAQTPNNSSYWIANSNTTGALQTPLSLGNLSSPTTTPSFQFKTTDAGSGTLEIHSSRQGSIVQFTRADANLTNVNALTLSSAQGSGSNATLYNSSNTATVLLNGQGSSYFNGGNVGIGTVTPGNLLEIATTSPLDGLKVGYNNTGLVRLHANSLTAGAYNNVVQNGDAGIVFGVNGTTINFGFVIAPWSSVTGGIRIASSGNMLIGKGTQTNSAYVLDVNGNERANSVVVNTNGADFVFDSGYRLPSLKTVAQYIKANHHLADIEPAQQMQQQGIDLGSSQTRLLQKIEELTLYLIDQNKELSALKEQNQILRKRIEHLEAKSR